MKRLIFYLCFPLFFSIAACNDNDDDFSEYTDREIELKQSESNDVIDSRLFELINLDYPGLEQVKNMYEKDLLYSASEALLEYFRSRTTRSHPTLSLINVTATGSEKMIADYALDNYRFYVNNYYEEAASGRPYSLLKNGAIDWTFEPEGADDEYQKQLHRHQWFVPQAKAYRETRDEKYVKSWVSVYKDWISNCPMPENGPNTTTWWQLQVSARITSQIELFEYYKNAISFTPQWMSTFLVMFATHADFLDKYEYAAGGNILVSQGNALAFAGVWFPEFKNASQWLDTGYAIMNKEVKSQFLEDGMHEQLDLSYHISAIADFYEVMKLAGMNNLANLLPSDFTDSLRKACELVMNMTYPNYFNTKYGIYCVPGFNDTRQASWNRSVLMKNFKRYVEMFPEHPDFLYMASSGSQGGLPDVSPKLYDKGGYYVMRNGWAPSSTVLIHSNNYDSSSNPFALYTHNQPDNGTFELYHNGRNFFPDSGVYTYYTSGGNNDDRRLYRRSRSHNTLTCNGSDYVNSAGKLLGSAMLSGTEVIATENQGYSNLKHRRYIFFVDKKFFVLVDEAIGSATGDVALYYHLCEGSTAEVVVDESENGCHTAFSDNNNILVRTFANQPIATTVFDGQVSYVNGTFAARKSYCVTTDKPVADTSRFISVIYPTSGNAGSIPVSAGFNGNYRENGVSLSVSVNGTTYPLNYSL